MGQKTCGSTPKAEAQGAISIGPKRWLLFSSSFVRTRSLYTLKGERSLGKGGQKGLESSHSHPLLVASAGAPGRCWGAVATGCHSHPASEPPHGASRAPAGAGGTWGGACDRETPEQDNTNLGAAGQESRLFFTALPIGRMLQEYPSCPFLLHPPGIWISMVQCAVTIRSRRGCGWKYKEEGGSQMKGDSQ